MKLDKLFVIGTLLFSTLAFTACGDDDDWAGPGEQETTDNPGVYFSTTNAGSIELDPTDPTSFTVELKRLNTSGALSVPLTVTNNPDSVFQVPATADFAAGDSTTTITVSFPNAEVGTAYTVRIDIPAEYRSLYKDVASGVGFSETIQRVKWNDVGSGVLTENTFTGNTATVTIQQRDDIKTSYRLVSPLASFFGATDNFVFTMNANGDVAPVMEDGIYDYFPNTGYYLYWNEARYSNYCFMTNTNGTLEWQFLLTDGTSVYTGGDMIFNWTDGYPYATDDEE